MKNYFNYRTQVNMKDYSGRFHFNELLKQEGSNINVLKKNNTKFNCQAVVRNYGIENKNTLEERSIIFDKSINIEQGDYVNYQNRIYLIISGIDDRTYFYSGKLTMCNQILNYRGLKQLLFAWSDNSSYGVKGESETTYTVSVDGKIQCFVQDNADSSIIQNGWRFILGKEKNQVYKVVDSSTVTNGFVLYIDENTEPIVIKGCRRIVMDRTVSCAKDDFEHNIAWMGWMEDKPTTEDKAAGESYLKSSMNSFTIRKQCDNEFVMMTADNMFDNGWTFTIDYNGVDKSDILIKEQTDDLIKIKNLHRITGSIILICTKGNKTINQEIKLVK